MMIIRLRRALYLVGILTAAHLGNCQVAVTTYHNDIARTGQNLTETILTLTNVNSNSFGRIGFLSTQGPVDAEPLYVQNVTVNGSPHNVVYVVTEHDMVYAFDADNLSQLWAVSVAGQGETPSDPHDCSQVFPEIGITSTPVIDVAAGPNGTIYLVAMSEDGNSDYHQRLHALDLSTGNEQINSPVEIEATYANLNGNLIFEPGQYKERAALLLWNGVIYMSFASHCDSGSYNSWIMGYSETTLQQVSVLNMTPNGSEGGVWMAEGGPAADGLGNIYLLNGNGTFDATLDANGFPLNGDFGNAFMKLSAAGNSLAAADYFAMSNVFDENLGDVDLGSGGVVLLPDFSDNAGQTWHLAVGAGKDGIIYLVNRDWMGRFNPNDLIYQEIPPSSGLGGGVFSTPAYFNNTLFYAAVRDHLKAFSIANAQLVAPANSQTSATFKYPGATPAISANGSSNAIVWAVENGSPGILHAYDASDVSRELYNSSQVQTRDQFQNSRFNTPMVANGRVFINGTSGVTVFGLLNSQSQQDGSPVARTSVFPNTGLFPLAVTASTEASFDPNATITSSTIDFGDGTAVSGATAQHTYIDSGTYAVRATLTDSLGVSVQATQTVRVGPLPDNAAFVTQQYADFLDRQPDSDGLNYWVDRLNHGLTRSQLVYDFLQYADAHLFTAQAYVGLLGRDADYSGFRFWVNRLENGWTKRAVLSYFIASGEFGSNIGTNLDNRQFVTSMYEKVLSREPDTDGYNYWVAQLDGGLGRADVALAFLQSPDFLTLTATQNRVTTSVLYFDLLRKSPDLDGMSYWTNQFTGGLPVTAAIYSFLGASDYTNRFLTAY